MSDRDDILKAIGADIRRWTIGPDGISAEGDDDTNNLLRVLGAHPNLPQALARRPDPEAEARMQMMLDIINRYPAGSAPEVSSAGDVQPGTHRPPNPLRMSQAIEQYKAACTGRKLAAKTVYERAGLLKKLAGHIATTSSNDEGDPFVHGIGTHHLSSFLDDLSMKAATDGSSTADLASPQTLMKKISNLRAFFEWAKEERQAALTDPTAGLGGRDQALRKSAAIVREHYEPFSSEQLKTIFEPHAYLAYNNHTDYFWAPLLGLHLGTRLKEVITLELADIARHEPTGIWFMDVRPENAKNPNSIRRLPIATRLVELGFIDYVERLRRLGATRLFPHRDASSQTARLDPSKNCSRRFGAYLDTRGISDPALVFHSFRHTVVTALQDAGTPLADSMQITGHQAQDHAIRTGRISADDAQSVHIKTYTHADKARLSTEYPLARLHQYLDQAVVAPLDYARLRRAADIVTEHLVKTTEGFKSGWSPLKAAHTEEQLQRV